MLPSSGKICEFYTVAENLNIWKCAGKNKRVCARKSQEREILIESTRREGTKIMN